MRPRYCCFYLHQRLHIGWARAESGGQVELVLSDGQTVRQREANMLYCWDGGAAADDNGAVALLEAHANAPEQQAMRLDALHAAATPGVPMPFAQWVAAAEASSKSGGEAVAGAGGDWARGLLFVAMLADGQRFRYSNGAFTARSAAEVAERIEREQREAAERSWVAQVERWRGELEAGHWPVAEAASPQDSQRAEFLLQLRSVLALEKRSPHWGLLTRPLGLHNLHLMDVSSRIKGWLVTADAWPGWPAVWLQRAEVPPRFAPEEVAAAAALAQAPPRDPAPPPEAPPSAPGGERAPGVRRAGGTVVYTIDSEGTRDYDDGYAVLEADARGVTVAMHIAEPDPALEPGHPLFDEAARRMSTVYSLEGIFPMFPEALSTGRFSLVAGAEREVLTLVLRIEEDGARLLDVARGRVCVARNLDYTAGQGLLDADPQRWGRLALGCAGLAEMRAAQGAIIRERRDTVLDISDPQQIRLSQVVRSGPAHQLVEELAILYNREAGRYCRDHRLPAIYRVQPPPRRSGASGEGAELPMAARFSTRGGAHAGLACDRYIQATSPIRRFPDVLMQRQIAEHATTGRVAFPERARLDEWAERADNRLAVCEEVTRRIANDWKARYLLQHRREVFDGIAQRGREGGHGRVWVEPLHLLAQCALPATVRDGDPVRLRLESVDRDHQLVWVACVE